MGFFSGCSSKPKAKKLSSAGKSNSGVGSAGGGFRHTGGIGFEGGKLVIAGLPEQTKKLFKEASRQKRRETGKGLTKRDVKHILKTYGAELRNPDALFAKAMLTAPAPAPAPAGGAPPVPSFDSAPTAPSLPPIPDFDPSAAPGTPGGPPPVPSFDPAMSAGAPPGAPPVPSFNPASFSPPSVEDLERVEQEMEKRVMAYEQEKQKEVDELRQAYDKLDGMYKELAKSNEALEAELAVSVCVAPSEGACLSRIGSPRSPEAVVM